MGYANFITSAIGFLELLVAAYALKLSRVFGVMRVGWMLVCTFCILAIVDLLHPSWFSVSGDPFRIGSSVTCAFVPLLLLAGLNHFHRQLSTTDKTSHDFEALAEQRVIELAELNSQLQREIARHEANENLLRASVAQYRLLFEGTPCATWVFDCETLRFLAVNDAAIRRYGYSREEFLAMKATDIRPAEDVVAFMSEACKENANPNPRGIWRHRKKDGTLMRVEITAADLIYDNRPAKLVIANDITERLALEDQLREAQKMELLGQLAGGVAHDFNNLLTVIQGYVSLLLADDESAETAEHVREIGKMAHRATSLTRQLLAFSRRSVTECEPLDLNAAVENMAKMLRRLIGEDIVLNIAHAKNLPPILADAGTIEQLVINLVVNARDAMPEGGTLTIGTCLEKINAEQIQGRPQAREGTFVRLSVQDTGSGIAPEAMPHLFEPFFTTKGIGKGTGLGLAIVARIAKQHSGWVEVESEPGKSSRFSVYFPCAPRAAIHGPNNDFPAFIGYGSGTVLVVEDDSALRELNRLILERHGYEVIEAESGVEALALPAQTLSRIDLLLTDVVMPGGISGRKLADRLLQIKPDLKIVFVSGYEPENLAHKFQFRENETFILKPCRADKLLRTVQESLSADRALVLS